MDSITALRLDKTELLEKISAAAKDRKTEAVLVASEKLKKIEEILNRFEQLESEIAGLNFEDDDLCIMPATIIRGKSASATSPRQSVKLVRKHGKEIRESFLNKLFQEGIALQLIRGETIYRTGSGEKVGIAVATERQPGRWFLGLPAGGFDHAILLCQLESGKVVDICLPKVFFSEYGNRLSESKGQLKFNVLRKGSIYVVKIPGDDDVNPADFAVDYYFLR